MAVQEKAANGPMPVVMTSRCLWNGTARVRNPLPFAALVRPLAPFDQSHVVRGSSEEWAKCAKCHAYLTRMNVDRSHCVFCGALNAAAQVQQQGQYSPPRRRARPLSPRFTECASSQDMDRLVFINDCSRGRIDIPVHRTPSSVRRRGSSSATDVSTSLENPLDVPQRTVLLVLDGNLLLSQGHALVDRIQCAVASMDENAVFGLIVITKMVKIYKVGGLACSGDVIRADIFSGAVSPRPDVELCKIERHEGSVLDWIHDDHQDDCECARSHRRYLGSRQSALALLRLLANRECKRTNDRYRPSVALGAALEYAIHLSKLSMTSSTSIATFLGNPCSIGPGAVTSTRTERFDPITDESVRQAFVYYSSLGERAAKEGVCINVLCVGGESFAMSCLDSLTAPNNGNLGHLVSLGDSSVAEVFAEIITRQSAVSVAVIRVTVSPGLVIESFLGPVFARAIPVTPSSGESKTCAHTTVVEAINCSEQFSFGIVLSADPSLKNDKNMFLQLEIQYPNEDEKVVQVVTIAIPVTADIMEYCASIDAQEQSAVIAQVLATKARNEGTRNVQSEFIRIADACRAFFPGQIFESRFAAPKSHDALQQQTPVQRVFRDLTAMNSSPLFAISACNADHQGWFRSLLLRGSSKDVASLAFPTLLGIDLNNSDYHQLLPLPSELSSLTASRIVLLDTFTKVLIWEGRDSANHDAAYALAMAACTQYAHQCIDDRRYRSVIVMMQQDSPTSRHLESKLAACETIADLPNTRLLAKAVGSLFVHASFLWGGHKPGEV